MQFNFYINTSKLLFIKHIKQNKSIKIIGHNHTKKQDFIWRSRMLTCQSNTRDIILNIMFFTIRYDKKLDKYTTTFTWSLKINKRD